MPKNYDMTWVPSGRRWRKHLKGKFYSVSCRQLGTEETKEASWRAANAWWAEQQKLADIPPEDARLQRAARISNLVREFSKLDDAARREAITALLGSDAYDCLTAKSGGLFAGMEASKPARTITLQVEAWKTLLRGVCQSGQMSEGRFDAYSRNIGIFVAWIGAQTPIDAIDETKLEEFYNHLSLQIGEKKYAPTYAHTILMTSKQFISRLAEMKLITLPGNIRSRRFRFNHSAPTKIETFTVAEVRQLLSACDGFSERTKLYILLQINIGMYQNDIAELKTEEVDWKKGTIMRARSKTRERGGPVVTYKLWPETFALLKKHRASGELALTTDEGNPLVKYWLEGNKYRRYDAIQSAWSRLAVKMGVKKNRLPMKHLRKTSSTILGQHSQFKFFANHFLADSPKGMADRQDVTPNEVEFFEALDWLRLQFTEGG